ncbi:MAG: M48 family metallopeptidase [Patescibacteria group bacterium]
MASYRFTKDRRVKGIKLLISREHGLEIKAPFQVPKVLIDKLLREKSDWISDKLKLVDHSPVPRSSAYNYQQYKKKTLKLVRQKIKQFNQHYQLSCQKISVRNQKTRWGSCSKKGNLNFNFRIGLLPDHLVDYIVVHELCHLKELNHSKKFWDLVVQTIPNHKIARRELRLRGLSIF